MSAGERIQVVDPLLGLLLGDYQVLEFIGEGGMGVVYRGIQPVVKKRVAIKVLKPAAAADATAVQKLLAEAVAVNAIGHRGIIDIFTHGQLPDGRPYIVMEFLEGQPLDHWLTDNGLPSIQAATEMLAQICAPLAAAHRSAVIHRDLKPSNIFLCQQPDGERFVKLLDFGLAKRGLGVDGKTSQTSQTEVAGTPDYMAPEQARALDVSPRTDIYALGVIAFEMFTGKLPFHGQTPMDVMIAHVRQTPPRVRDLCPDLPQPLESLVMSMLEKSPEKRPQSVEEVRERLEAFASEQGSPLRRASRPDQPAVRPTPPGASPPTEEALPPPPEEAPAAPASSGSGWKWAGGLAAVATVLLAVLLLLPQPGEVLEPPGPATPIQLPASMKLAPAPVAPVEAAAPVEPDAEADAEEELDDLAPLPTMSAKARPVREPPTAQALTARLGRLEARAAKHPNLDPSAIGFLSRFRIEATAADTTARRAKLARAIDEWERSFLAK
ncbi:MAG: serine/threonine-protein kinase [Archangium sp.]|nr:serine/threonine-protein kinase [Archangium sp.]